MDDPAIIALRRRQMRNLAVTLILSQGTPMILGGDEFGATRKGNNNVYCQDNELSWQPWDQGEEASDMLETFRKALQLRRDHPVFCRRSFFKGRRIAGKAAKDIHWFRPDGVEMGMREWSASYARTIGVLLSGEALPDPDEQGAPMVDDSFLLLFNAHWESVEFRLPKPRSLGWEVVMDTSERFGDGPVRGGKMAVESRSLMILRSPRKASA